MTVVCMYMSKCMYNGIYIYVCGEGGLRSEKIWGVTVDKWEGMIGAKFFVIQMAPRKLR